MSDYIDDKEIITGYTKKVIDRVVNWGAGKASTTIAKIKNSNQSSFVQYTIKKRAYLRATRNLIYNEHSAILEKIYVKMKIRYSGRVLNEDDFIPWFFSDIPREELIEQAKTINEGNRTDGHGQWRQGHKTDREIEDMNSDDLIQAFGLRKTRTSIIIGQAGAGKSFFLRHMFFSVHNNSIRIPLLLEARSFHRRDFKSIEDVIYDDLDSIGCKIQFEQITVGLESGIFCLMIDGIDEIHIDIRSKFEVYILRFSQKYHACPILITSRSSDLIDSRYYFDTMELCRFEREDSVELVKRIEYDEETKSRFIDELRNKLYDEHLEFASNPLLCTVMLITYFAYGAVSTHRHEFYDDAFNALWNKHDAKKPEFVRNRYTKLTKAEFISFLSAFSTASYLRSDYSINSQKFIEHVKTSMDITGISCIADDFRNDLVETCSLCMQIGDEIRFIHRSFQEYFCSVFISNMSKDGFFRICQELCKRSDTDSVLFMSFSTNRQNIEMFWILPRLREIIKRNGIEWSAADYENTCLVGVDYLNRKEIDEERLFLGFLRQLDYGLMPQKELYSIWELAKSLGFHIGSMRSSSHEIMRQVREDKEKIEKVLFSLEVKSQTTAVGLDLLLPGAGKPLPALDHDNTH